MATRVEGLIASVVHDAEPRARAEGLFFTAMHDAPPRARAEGLFFTAMHDTPPRARAEGLFFTAMHDVGSADGGNIIQGQDEIIGASVQCQLIADLTPGGIGN